MRDDAGDVCVGVSAYEAGDGQPPKDERTPRRVRMPKVRGAARRSGEEASRLLAAVGVRAQLSGEAQDLARLIEHRLAHCAEGDDEEATDQLEIQRAYLAHRFVAPMKAYERGQVSYKYLDSTLNILSIFAGVGVSLTAALGTPKAWGITLGLFVGLLQSISQWLKPSRRSARQGLAATALTKEAWSFLQRRDRYRDRDDRGAWSTFCDQITIVEEREETDEEKDSGRSGGTQPPTEK